MARRGRGAMTTRRPGGHQAASQSKQSRINHKNIFIQYKYREGHGRARQAINMAIQSRIPSHSHYPYPSHSLLLLFYLFLSLFPLSCLCGVVDLHTHSTLSDGTLSLSALQSHAASLGLRALSLTDHDRVPSPLPASEGAGEGPMIIYGIEISVEWPLQSSSSTVKAHLLAYFLDLSSLSSSSLSSSLSSLAQRRQERNRMIFDKLALIFPGRMVYDEFVSFAAAGRSDGGGRDLLGRPHMARYLLHLGLVASIAEAFDKYLSDQQLNLPEWGMDIKEAVNLVSDAGGVSVLAHPATLGLSVEHFEAELTALIAGGQQRLPLKGLECASSKHTLAQERDYKRIADRLGLLVSGGSDYHGTNKEAVTLGQFVKGGQGEGKGIDGTAWERSGGFHLNQLLTELSRSSQRRLSDAPTALAGAPSVAMAIQAIHAHGPVVTHSSLITSVLSRLAIYLFLILAIVFLSHLLVEPRAHSGPLGALQRRLQATAAVKYFFTAVPTPSPSLTPVAPAGRLSPSHLLSSFSSLCGRHVYAHFLFCFLGLQLSYIAWGFLQERIMTVAYDGQHFMHSEFLVLLNRVFSASVALLCLLALEAARAPAVGGVRCVPPYKYALCSLSNVLSSWFQYEALHFVSFPLQVLSKSSKVLFTMLMGRLVSGLHYKAWEYLSAVMIAAGLLVYRMAEAPAESGSSLASAANSYTFLFGVFLLVSYIVSDSFTSNWQGALFKRYRVHPLSMMLGVNVFSSLMALLMVAASHQLGAAIAFVLAHPACLWDCLAMSAFSSLGQLFIFHTIACFGPVSFASIMTARQLLSLLLSLRAFGHSIGSLGWLGLGLVFASLAIKIFHDVRKEVDKKEKGKTEETNKKQEENV